MGSKNRTISLSDYIYTKDHRINQIMTIDDDDDRIIFYTQDGVYTFSDILENDYRYLYLIDKIIDLHSEWKTKKVIQEELNRLGIKFDEREFRLQIEKHNFLFSNHMDNKYMAHSVRGYILTENVELIKCSLVDYRNRALDQLTKYSKGMKAIGENYNFKMQVENNSLIFVEGSSFE